MENIFWCFSTKTHVVGTKIDLLNETVLLKTNNTCLNLLIRENLQSLSYASLLNLTKAAYKMHFSVKCISGSIASYQALYLDYQYTQIQPYSSRVQKFCVFARYPT